MDTAADASDQLTAEASARLNPWPESLMNPFETRAQLNWRDWSVWASL